MDKKEVFHLYGSKFMIQKYTVSRAANLSRTRYSGLSFAIAQIHISRSGSVDLEIHSLPFPSDEMSNE